MFCIYQQKVDLIFYCNQVSDVALGLLFCIYRKPTYLNYNSNMNDFCMYLLDKL